MRFKPPTIQEIGLEKYLDSTRDDHNGFGYDELVKRIQLKEPKSVIARAFGVDRRTIDNWIEVYEKEAEK